MAHSSSASAGAGPGRDPRDIVTPYAFEVEPALLGKALASPWRRLAALLLDLLIATIIAGLGGVLLGFAIALLFFRFATRERNQPGQKRWNRAAAFAGACVLFVTVLVVTDNDDGNSDADQPVMTASGFESGDFEEMRDSVSTTLARQGIDVAAFSDANLPPAVAGILNIIAQPSDSLAPAERSEAAAVLRAYAQALADSDQATLDSLQVEATSIVAGDQLRRLRKRLNAQQDRYERLEDRAEELEEAAENPGLWRTISATGEEFGLGIGWLGVYFTLSMAWWNGRTIGKRLFGLRVVRLNGEPLTLWYAFERFGGYAAGIATGLLGFAQILWDPNRQGIHDRIAGTVVLYQRGASASPPSDANHVT